MTDRVISVRLQLTIDRANRDAKQFGGTLTGVATTADKAGKQLTQLGTAGKGVGTSLAKGTATATASIGGLNSRLGDATSSLKSFAKLGAVVGAVHFFGTMIDEAEEAERTTRQTEAVIRSTGGAANVTAGQVSDLADKLSQKTAVDDEVVAHGENVLLTFKNIRNEVGAGNDIFNQTTAVALDMSAALSQSGDASEGLQSNSVRLGKALNDPIAGISALTRVGVTFTAQQKAQIRALVESGDILSAQKIILGELTSEFGGMGEASATSIGKAKVSWKNFAEELGGKVMPAVNAVSNWALHTGLPALGDVASTVGDVVTPAFHGLVAAGGGVVGMWQSLPGPIQAGAIAMGAWMLVGDKVSGFFGRTTGPLRTFGQDVQHVMTASGGEVGKFGASMQVLQDKVPALGAMGSAFRTAKGDVAGFGSTLKGVAMAGISGLKSAATGLMGFFGGPWGLALTAATVGLTFLAGQSAKAEARQQDLANAGKHVAEVLREQGGVINEKVRAAAAADAEDKGMLKAAQDLGIALPAVTNAITGQSGALEGLRTKLQAIIDANKVYATDEFGNVNWTGQLTDQGIAAKNLLNDVNALAGGRDSDTAAAAREVEATGQVNLAHTAGMTSTELYRQAIERAGIEYDETAGLAEQLKAAVDALTAAEMSRIDTLESYEAAQDALTSSVQANGHSLDVHTEAGRKNRDALEDVAKKSRDLMMADIESGVPMNQALARHNDRIAALRTEAGKTFAAKAEANKLITAYSKIPKDVRTAIQAEGYEAVKHKLDVLYAQQVRLEGKNPVPLNLGNIKRESRAGGGPIHGPGGPTSDDVPIWASSGEFMQRAAAVDYYGTGFMEAVNSKRFPKEMAQGFAGGGAVWPFPVDVTKTRIPPPMLTSSSAAAGSPAVVAAVRAVAARYGWGSGAQWSALSSLISHESGWNPGAANPTSSARGLFQKLTSMHGPLEATVGGQAQWGLNYIRGRYGSPAAAWSAWNSRSPHWYAQGGAVKGGDGAALGGLGGLGDFMRGTYRRGTDRVPMDGLYQLHRGEKVSAAGRGGGGEAVLTIRSDGTLWADAVVDTLHKADKTGRLQLEVRR